MPNIVKATTVPLYYIVVKTDENPILTEQIIKINPPSSTIVSNAEDLPNRNFSVRGNFRATENYIINQSADINNKEIPDWTESTDGQTDYDDKNASQLDSILKVYLSQYNNLYTTIDANYTLDLSHSLNEPLNDGVNNTYFVQIKNLYVTAGFTFTLLFNN